MVLFSCELCPRDILEISPDYEDLLKEKRVGYVSSRFLSGALGRRVATRQNRRVNVVRAPLL